MHTVMRDYENINLLLSDKNRELIKSMYLQIQTLWVTAVKVISLS